MAEGLPANRLLAIIATQNEITASALNLDAAMALVVRRARDLTSAAAAVVELADGPEMVYHVGAGAAAAHAGLRLRMASSLSGRSVREGATLYCQDASADARVDAEACRRGGAESMVCVPLRHGGQAIGVLKVYDPRPHAFDSDDRVRA